MSAGTICVITALVLWVIGALDAAYVPASHWGGALALPDAALGLYLCWEDTVRPRLGGYAAMCDRNLGDGSPLLLPADPNAPWPAGLLLPPEPR
ncbi:MAG TPA: hypothetical protein VMI52_06825 [Acetobacteraceae bacterium]|nr:hypothetical protein [Acetobacteraceae bacterium]